MGRGLPVDGGVFSARGDGIPPCSGAASRSGVGAAGHGVFGAGGVGAPRVPVVSPVVGFCVLLVSLLLVLVGCGGLVVSYFVAVGECIALLLA